MTDLFFKEIPVPSTATINNITIVITGEFPDEIMEKYTK
ncbi:hypothetical protein DSBG_4215 [Desulfosporosinus sp. BG]|nr:hypothetical protein DSBG_4215 [Desulfosporosinus sp. BG]